MFIGEYAAHVVPGLLQTKEYARAVLRVGVTLDSEEQLEERLTGRLERQERLASPDRPRFWAVLSKTPNGPVLTVRTDSWTAFVTQFKA